MAYTFKFDPQWSRNPDKVIRNFKFDDNIQPPKNYDERLGENLTLRVEFKKLASGEKHYRKAYYFVFQNKLMKVLGNANEMTFREAIEASVALASETVDQTDKTKLKTTIREVFEQLEKFNQAWSPATAAKKEKIFYNRFGGIFKKGITELTKADIIGICDEIYREKKYAALSDFFELACQITKFAFVRDLVEKDPLYGLKLSDLYKISPTQGHPTIKTETDLKLLIRYVCGYNGRVDVKNSLKLGLLTALRAGNVRSITSKNIQTDESGEFFLYFSAEQMKIKKEEHIGIPRPVGVWLLKLALDVESGTPIFTNYKGAMLSDAILSKSLKNYVPLDSTQPLVFHSFRKIFSTFGHEKMRENMLSSYDIERTLCHVVGGVSGCYNKSSNISNTRRALSWWFDYLKSLGFEL